MAPAKVKTPGRIHYQRRTMTLIESFKARQISFQECLRELDAAFEQFLVPNKIELSASRNLVLENNNAVMQEMAARPIHLLHNRKKASAA